MVCSKKKELQIERLIIFHFEKLKWEFESKLYCEDYMENVHEIHFVINFHNKWTLGFLGDFRKKMQIL